MSTMTDQFIEAIRQWAEKTSNPEQLIAVHMFMLANGQWCAEPDRSSSASVEATLNFAKQNFTLDGIRRFIETTQRMTGFSEMLIVLSFVHAIEDIFRTEAALYVNKQEAREEWPKLLRAMATDPEQFKSFQTIMDNSREKREELGISFPNAKQLHTPEDLLEAADAMERLVTNANDENVLKHAKADREFEVWKEVIAPILDVENIDRNYSRSPL